MADVDQALTKEVLLRGVDLFRQCETLELLVKHATGSTVASESANEQPQDDYYGKGGSRPGLDGLLDQLQRIHDLEQERKETTELLDRLKKEAEVDGLLSRAAAWAQQGRLDQALTTLKGAQKTYVGLDTVKIREAQAKIEQEADLVAEKWITFEPFVPLVSVHKGLRLEAALAALPGPALGSLADRVFDGYLEHVVVPVLERKVRNLKIEETVDESSILASDTELDLFDDLYIVLHFYHTCILQKLNLTLREKGYQRMAVEVTQMVVRFLQQAVPESGHDLEQFCALAKRAATFDMRIADLGYASRDEDSSISLWCRNISFHFARKRQCYWLDRIRVFLLHHDRDMEPYGMQFDRIEEAVTLSTRSESMPQEVQKNETSTTLPADQDEEDAWDVDLDLTGIEAPEQPLKDARHSINAGGRSLTTSTRYTKPVARSEPQDAAALEEDTTALDAINHDEADGWGWEKEVEDWHSPDQVEAELPNEATYERYTVSRHSIKFLDIVREIIDEADSLVLLPRPQVEAQVALVRALPDFLALYRAIVPFRFAKELTQVPSLSMQFVNDCRYLARQLTELSRTNAALQADIISPFLRLGETWYRSELSRQTDAVLEVLTELNGMRQIADKENLKNAKTCMSNLIVHLQGLSRSWQSVLATEVYEGAMGYVVDYVMAWIIDRIEEMEDISADESEHLAALCKTLQPLEALFSQDPHDRQQGSSPAHESAATAASSSIVLHVPRYLKFSYLGEMLTASMADILYLHDEGALIDFQQEELVHLLIALFADSELRQKNIARLRAGVPR